MSWNNFQNRTCEYYPCHNVDPETFNCWGCYCPLFPYQDCGGACVITNGFKDCSNCTRPHDNPLEVLDELYKRMFNL